MIFRIFVFFAQTALLISFAVPSAVSAGEKNADRNALAASNPKTNNIYRSVTAANVFNYYSNNGDGSNNPYNGNSGFEFPKGSVKTALFEDGLVWGGNHNGIIKVGGSTYRHGLQAGRILSPGGPLGKLPIADNPMLVENRVYRVRPDINPNTPLTDSIISKIQSELNLLSRYENISVYDIYNQYVADWNNWPAGSGAPFIDVNKNGIYEPSIDIPGVAGASQSLWYVSNDMDPSLTLYLAGSAPIGLEMQKTIWVISGDGFIGNSIFSRTKLINKSGSKIDSMYFTQWSDPDLGDAGDDFVGCDTLLGLGYVYNGKIIDGVYGAQVPAVGFVFLQGPIVSGAPNDSAYFQGRIIKGFKNLGMSSFNFFINQNATYTDPPLGNKSGTTQWYNLMMGTIGQTGAPYINPITGKVTSYVLSGDPIAGTGWVDGTIAAPGDRRMAQTTGPFTFAKGDTQEVVVATSVMQGADRLASIRLLKDASSKIWKYYRGLPVASITALSQEYYSLQSQITFKASVLLPTGEVGVGQWIVSQRPPGSVAAIQTNVDGSATLRPDVAGNYKIGYVAGGGTIWADTDYVAFKATANQPPTVNFSFPASVKVGDVVILDGSITNDPNGDSLNYNWGTNLFFTDFKSSYDTLPSLTNITQAKATFTARKAGTYNITLSVKDSFFSVSLTKNLTVNPMISGTISRSGQYPTSVYPAPPSTGFYYAPRFSPQTDGLWALINGAPLLLNLASNLSVPLQWYNVVLGAPFIASNAFIVGIDMVVTVTDGKGKVLSSYQLDAKLFLHSSWNGYSSTGDSLVTGVYYSAPYLYVASGMAGVYQFNCSNPFVIVPSGHFYDGNYWNNFHPDGSKLLSYNSRNGKVLVLDISNPAAMSKTTEFPLRLLPTKFGSLYAGTANDTLFVYSGNSGYPLVLKSTTIAPKSVNIYNKFSTLWADGPTIAAGTFDGVYIYDASSLTSLQMTHKYITGWFTPSVYVTGSRILFMGTRGGDYTYEGLNDLQFGPASVDRLDDVTPLNYQLLQNYPNPFNPSTTIQYGLPSAGRVSIKIFNILGQQVADLINTEQSAGWYETIWNANGASGLYFYRIDAVSSSNPNQRFTQLKKMLLLK